MMTSFVKAIFIVLCSVVLASCGPEKTNSEYMTESEAPLETYPKDEMIVQPPPPPPPAPIASAEPDLLSQLRTYPIAYEAPKSAVQSQSFSVTLAIDATGDDNAAEALPGISPITEAQVRLTRQVEPNLSGAAFDITLLSPERQTLSPVTENVWRWSVTPRDKGRHTLNMEIYAYLENGESMPLKSYQDAVEVTVSAGQKTSWFTENLRLVVSLLGGIVSLLLGSIALWAHIKKS